MIFIHLFVSGSKAHKQDRHCIRSV